MHRLLRAALLSPPLLLGACGGPAEIEGGLNDAECSDGLDNDQSGLADCDDPSCEQALACRFPDDDTGGGDDPRPGAVEITDLWYDCDAIGYFFDVTLEGTGHQLAINLVNMTKWDQWTERHPFPTTPYEIGPDDAWEIHYVELDTQDWEGHIELGETTFFDCKEREELTYTLFVTDTSGEPLDCFVWGADPAGADALQGTSCEVLTHL